MECNTSSDAPVVLFVSKVFAAPVGHSSGNIDSGPRIAMPQAKASGEVSEPEKDQETPSERFIGFGRIFSGTLRKGQKVYVLGPKYNPHYPDKHFSVLDVEV